MDARNQQRRNEYYLKKQAYILKKFRRLNRFVFRQTFNREMFLVVIYEIWFTYCLSGRNCSKRNFEPADSVPKKNFFRFLFGFLFQIGASIANWRNEKKVEK